MRPSALTPMTPALAPASTASVKRRRLSIRSRARTMSSCCVRSSCVILLKVSPNLARSPSERRTGTWMLQIAGRNHIGGADQAADRRDQPVGEIESDPGRGQQHDQRDDGEHQRERDLDAEPARFEIGIFADALLRRAQLLHHPRIEKPRDIEIHVVIAVQLDDGGDVIALRDEGDLRLGFGDLAEKLRRRQHDLLSIVTSARSTVEPSGLMMMAAERLRPVACAVRNLRN